MNFGFELRRYAQILFNLSDHIATWEPNTPLINMEFINDDIFQILKEGHPFRMMGKDG